jgi:hypothetical protein
MTVKELSSILEGFSGDTHISVVVDMSDQHGVQTMERNEVRYAGVQEKTLYLQV